MAARQELRHPIDTLRAFRGRIRVYDVLGASLGDNPNSAVNLDDIGMGLIALVEDYEAAAAEVEAWFEAQKGKEGAA